MVVLNNALQITNVRNGFISGPRILHFEEMQPMVKVKDYFSVNRLFVSM